jgi:hypothetical protein
MRRVSVIVIMLCWVCGIAGHAQATWVSEDFTSGLVFTNGKANPWGIVWGSESFPSKTPLNIHIEYDTNDVNATNGTVGSDFWQEVILITNDGSSKTQFQLSIGSLQFTELDANTSFSITKTYYDIGDYRIFCDFTAIFGENNRYTASFFHLWRTHTGFCVKDNLTGDQLFCVDAFPVSIPTAAWLLGSGLLGLAGAHPSVRNRLKKIRR